MACVRSKLVLTAIASASFFVAESSADAAVAYVRSDAGSPWGTTDNEQAMDLVFGAAAWDDLRFESADPEMLFSAAYTFIYIDGSDVGAIELQTFMIDNQAALESWVAAGGRLFLNSAPNEGTDQSWGFLGTTLVYTAPGAPAAPYNASHPIWLGPFLPTNPVVNGGGYAHATVSGGGLTPLIVDMAGAAALGELPAYGEGAVIFGGLTVSTFWISPQDGLNLRTNILWYLGQRDTDADGVLDPVDLCIHDADPGQEDGDADTIGDACDACAMDPDNDADADLVCGDVDNCPAALNFNQADVDRDSVGDVCDTCPGDAEDDADADGVCGDVDVCPDVADPDQADGDGDGVGDACETAGDTTHGMEVTGDPLDTSGSAEGTEEGSTGNTSVGTDGGTADTGTQNGDGGGCGCSTPPRTIDALWLAFVFAIPRRRAQGGNLR